MKNAGPGPSVTSTAGAVTELEPNGSLSDGAAVGMKSDQLGFHDIAQVREPVGAHGTIKSGDARHRPHAADGARNVQGRIHWHSALFR